MAWTYTKTIGGTDVAAILGVHPWKSELQAWEGIREHVQIPVNEAMARGTRLEAPVAEIARDILGMTLVEPPEGTITLDDVFSATPDRVAYDSETGQKLAIVEIKTAGSYGTLDPLPRHYELQCQHYMWACGVDVAYLVGIKTTDEVYRLLETADDIRRAIGKKAVEVHVHKIFADPSYASKTVPRLRQWFEKHIVNDEMPSVSSRAADAGVIDRACNGRQGEEPMSPRLRQLIDHYNDAKQRESKAKEEKQYHLNEIRQEMGTLKKSIGDDYAVSFSPRKGALRLDGKALKEQEPDVWQRYAKRGQETISMRITEVKS